MPKYIVLINSNEIVRVSPDRIVYILSEGNYSTMTLVDKEEHVFYFNLAAFEKIIEQQLRTDAQTFIRLGKSLIINGRYIYYVNVSKQQIVLSDSNSPNRFTLSASKKALKALKVGLEESIKSRRIGKHSALKPGRGTLPHKKGKSHDFPVFLTLNLNLYEKNVLQR